jgi:hypothetical protein
LQTGFETVIEPLGADLVFPDLHALFVLIGRLGAGPSDELRQTTEMISDEPTDGVGAFAIGSRLIVDHFGECERLAVAGKCERGMVRSAIVR